MIYIYISSVLGTTVRSQCFRCIMRLCLDSMQHTHVAASIFVAFEWQDDTTSQWKL